MKFLDTFKEDPQRQKTAGVAIDQAVEKLRQNLPWELTAFANDVVGAAGMLSGHLSPLSKRLNHANPNDPDRADLLAILSDSASADPLGKLTEDEAAKIASEAYIFGNPLILMDVNKQVMIAVPKPTTTAAPVN